MNQDMNRRHFVKGSVLATTAAALATGARGIAVESGAAAKGAGQVLEDGEVGAFPGFTGLDDFGPALLHEVGAEH